MKIICNNYEDLLGKKAKTIYGDTAIISGIHVYYSLTNGGSMSVQFYLQSIRGYFKLKEIEEIEL